MEINLNLRSDILECSLHMEKEINNLLLLLLGIHSDNKETRLFGNRAGTISFKNKIDLLYDLQILSKEENFDFELLMTFRNKFLHDIDCNSFSSVFEQLGNGIKNKFKNFIEEGESINDEKACLSAFKRLFLKNLKVLSKKIESKKTLIKSKAELFHVFNDQIIYQIDLFFDLISEIYLTLESTDLNNKKTQESATIISKLCQKFVDRYSNDEKYQSLKIRHRDIFLNPEIQKEFWNIAKSEDFESKIKELKKEL